MNAKKRDFPKRGLYLLSERGAYLYVGIAGTGKRGTVRTRLRSHFAGTSSLNKRIADEIFAKITGRTIPRGKKNRRASKKYRDARSQAKTRIGAMDVRFVTWTDGDGDNDDLALLEMYAAHVLKTPYNVRGGHLAEQSEQ